MANDNVDGTVVPPTSQPQYARKKQTMAPDLAGETLDGRYEVLTKVGQGNMGALYRGRHKDIGREVAIKVLHEQLTSDSTQLMRFKQEAKVAGSLNHPNVCAVYDFGETCCKRPYLVMDYIDGPTLSALIKKEGSIPVRRALPWFIQVCEGLKHAHHKGLVHRDLKPSNIMISTADDAETAKLVDFGIAKVTDKEEALHLTQTGEVFGSPLYMSPEQCQGFELDARSDVYSLGCTMYETLTGRPPLKGENAVQTIVKHISTPAPSMSSICAPTDPALDAIVDKCMQKAAADRYQSVDELANDLRQYWQSHHTQAPAECKKRSFAKMTVIPVVVALAVGAGAAYLLAPKQVIEMCSIKEHHAVADSNAGQGAEPKIEYTGSGFTQPTEAHVVYVRRAMNQTTADEDRGENPGIVEVHVTKDHPSTVLVLCSYAPVDWKISADPGVTIPKVILSGIMQPRLVSDVKSTVLESYETGRDGAENKGFKPFPNHGFMQPLSENEMAESSDFKEQRDALRQVTKGLGSNGKGLEVNTYRYADQSGKVTI